MPTHGIRFIDYGLKSPPLTEKASMKIKGRSPQRKKGGYEGQENGVVYYLPVVERTLCLIFGFSRKTDSARFKALLTPATPKFNSRPD